MPDQWGGRRSENSERFSSSIVALDLDSGQLRWVFQTVRHDLWDMDVPAQPSLIDIQTEEGPVPALAGTFTVLADSGLDDAEIIAWMTARDETLPGGPTPLAAIRAGHKTEVRRRAMEEAL